GAALRQAGFQFPLPLSACLRSARKEYSAMNDLQAPGLRDPIGRVIGPKQVKRHRLSKGRLPAAQAGAALLVRLPPLRPDRINGGRPTRTGSPKVASVQAHLVRMIAALLLILSFAVTDGSA